jgi:hypothetical protein
MNMNVELIPVYGGVRQRDGADIMGYRGSSVLIEIDDLDVDSVGVVYRNG